MDKYLSSLFFAFVIAALSSCTEKATINIAVASNFEHVLKSIVERYQQHHQGIQINIISGSSGVLTNQINNNAPFDLFLSADSKKPQLIFESNKHLYQPQVYAFGKLALWIPASTSKDNCLKQLENVMSISIANPKTAPYGEVSADIIQASGIKLKKIINTANITQSFLYTKDNLTQAGFVAYSRMQQSAQGCIQIFTDNRLKQSMILLDEKAENIYQFILSEEIQTMIKNSGYNILTKS